MIRKMMTGEHSASPAFWMIPVDIQDVTRAHLRSLHVEKAANQRFLLTGDRALWLQDMAITFGETLNEAGYDYKVSQKGVPYCLLWLISWFSSELAAALPLVGLEYNFENQKSKTILGLEYARPLKTVLLETAEALIKSGKVPEKRK